MAALGHSHGPSCLHEPLVGNGLAAEPVRAVNEPISEPADSGRSRSGCLKAGALIGAALLVAGVVLLGPQPRPAASLTLAADVALSRLVAPRNDSFAFLMVGDWGGESDENPLNWAEQQDAIGMGRVASQLRPEFVLALGDNFYDAGVTSATAATRFELTFEKAFEAQSLQVPFYAIAGNHDHLGDVGLQIAYTGRGSGRWQYPESHYIIKRQLPDGKRLEIVMFDTVVAVGYSYQMANGTLVRAAGPFDAAAASRQWTWIEEMLATSTADYLFTAGHYPVFSVCQHGSIMEFTRLPELLRKYRANGHLAGHDHCLQHFEEDGLHFVGSGAGSEGFYQQSFPAPNSMRFLLAEENRGDILGGFASMVIQPEGAHVFYYSNDGTVLYKSGLIQPRKRAIRGRK